MKHWIIEYERTMQNPRSANEHSCVDNYNNFLSSSRSVVNARSFALVDSLQIAIVMLQANRPPIKTTVHDIDSIKFISVKINEISH